MKDKNEIKKELQRLRNDVSKLQVVFNKNKSKYAELEKKMAKIKEHEKNIKIFSKNVKDTAQKLDNLEDKIVALQVFNLDNRNDPTKKKQIEKNIVLIKKWTPEQKMLEKTLNQKSNYLKTEEMAIKSLNPQKTTQEMANLNNLLKEQSKEGKRYMTQIEKLKKKL